MATNQTIKQGDTVSVTSSNDTVNITSSDSNGAAVVSGDSNKVNLNGGYVGLSGNGNTVISQASLLAIHGNSNGVTATNQGGNVEIDAGTNNYVVFDKGNCSFNDYGGNVNTLEIGQNVPTLNFAGTVNDRLIFDNFTQDAINYAFNHMSTYTASNGQQYTDIILNGCTIHTIGSGQYAPSLFYVHAKNDDSNLFTQNVNSGEKNWTHASKYNGPNVGPLNDQYVPASAISDNLNLTYRGSGGFIHGSNGNDGIDVSQSTGQMNILDGGLGSNFLTGSKSGYNVFYNDDRYTGSTDTWSTCINGHAGDQILNWGLQSNNWPDISWVDNEGANGYKGLTMHLKLNGHTDSLTIVGCTTADLNNGKLAVSFGKTDDSTYMLIKFNS
jgi:hypothetical protein